MIGMTELTNHINTSPLLRAHFLRVPSFYSSNCGAFTVYYYRDTGFYTSGDRRFEQEYINSLAGHGGDLYLRADFLWTASPVASWFTDVIYPRSLIGRNLIMPSFT